MGMPLCQKMGFIAVDETVLEVNMEDPSDEWKACQRKLLPYSWRVFFH